MSRLSKIRETARLYVEDGLGQGNFDIIPYHHNISLIAPLNPGGSEVALAGKVMLMKNGGHRFRI